MHRCSVFLLLTRSGFSAHAAPGIGVYPFCKSKLAHRFVKPDLRAGETDNLPPVRERILRLRLAFIFTGSLFESRKIYASPGPEGLEEREKKSIRGYGRCIDTCPRHRPLPAPEAAHIRHPARTGKLGAS